MDKIRMLFSGLTVVMTVLTLLPFCRCQAWWVRVWDFPRLQMAATAVALLVAELCLLPGSGGPVLAGIPAGDLTVLLSLACALYQAHWIIPYTRLWPVQVKRSRLHNRPTLKILTANVLMTNRNAAALKALVREHQPDVLVALETDSWWQAELDGLARGNTGAPYTFQLKCPQDNLYGMHVYSRLPMKDAMIQYLVADGIPSMHFRVELDSGDEVVMHCLHPMPPSPTEDDQSTNRDGELVAVGHCAARARYPTIVTGDLNDVAWSRTTRLFMKVSGLLDPRRGRGMFNTFHAGIPCLRWPLDHVFHSRDFTLVRMQRLPYIGSDHFPILAELALNPRVGRLQQPIELAAGDRLEAREKMASAGIVSRQVHSAEN
ncbi:endonuclease [Chimaeribacter californicus]|uniref:Endonuclease n=1 Tax=Chimaeribacter californicus TaxID=2060067 RepID=A0A2N5DZ60_9GAMM|nr:endonuclease/exonuclease/phosphatase family protein [Chimaeribacter californicus]PLR33027.1 endonuclease [Chimaeribacter californicus]